MNKQVSRYLAVCRSAAIALLVTAFSVLAQPKFPVGMNIQGLSYWDAGYFNDVFTASGNWITYHSESGWDTQVCSLLQCDTNGYPTYLPQLINGNQTMVRTMLNNCYTGRFRITWEGDGDIAWNVPHELTGGKHYVTFDGSCSNRWIQITRSNVSNPLRTIRILPDSLADSYDPTNAEHLFQPLFIRGVRPFHTLRFMDWMGTNGSTQKTWSSRSTPTYFNQSVRGTCIEYAITLCNYLGVDAWFCVPHAADDTYIRQFALLVRERLDPRLNVYIEYSNEIWNWQFQQAQWACRNGRYGDTALWSSDSLRNQLRAVGQQYCSNATDDCLCHPEKDAHLMARVFKIWHSVFAEASQESRLIRTAAVQVGWCSNSSRILSYLVTRGGCDALSPTGYFNFTEADHNTWNANPTAVTPAMVTGAVSTSMNESSFWSCVRTTADQARQYSLKLVMYEAGQHMQPWNQGEWAYNQAVWDAQIHSSMYDLYIKYFRMSDSIYTNFGTGGIDLCCAFSYVSNRESRWGSWGHLESYRQLLDLTTMKTSAPKYQALLDMNTPRTPVTVAPGVRAAPVGAARLSLRAISVSPGRVTVTFTTHTAGSVRVKLFDSQGRLTVVLADAMFTAGTHTVVANRATSRRVPFPAGYYILRLETVSAGRSVSQQSPIMIF